MNNFQDKTKYNSFF